ncbi:MAG: DUF819 family protein [Steroidobacteraceae bacterium]|nr:DUF819 family protein [Steroidobacteraceae bacterium]MDW8260010.1 DUF819 family protein [Gammaproteobacteria bacterium]
MLRDDATILGLLVATLGAIFWTAGSAHPFWRRFYRFVPALLLCYFLPALYNTAGLIDVEDSRLYFVASRYLLPATLVLLTLAIDLPAILRLGPQVLTLFFAGTASVIAGAPVALWLVGLVSPATVAGETWRGLTAVAGSWIGGGANQAAMKDVFAIPVDLFGAMVAVDVIVASLWMAVLLYLAGRAAELDARRGADTAAVDALRERIAAFEREHARNPSLRDLVLIAAVGFGLMGLSHALGVPIARAIDAAAPQLAAYSLTSEFFWIVVLATTFGVLASFTPARALEGAGASKIGSLLLYVLVATIGMQMDLGAIVERPGLFVVGAVWMGVHAAVMFAVLHWLRAPLFYLGVGSMANIGGAASAPVVASAFHPALAPVGVLLAVLGYALGTYGGWLAGQLLRWVAE